MWERSLAEDQIDAVEALHNVSDPNLHLRFIGTAAGRQFVVSVQFPVGDEKIAAERLQPDEQVFLTAKILALVNERLTGTANSELYRLLR